MNTELTRWSTPTFQGVWFTVQHGLDTLRDHDAVWLVASAATKVVQRHAVYSSTKAAAVKMAETLADDLAERGVRVNSLSPGGHTSIVGERLKQETNFLTDRELHMPLKRLGRVEDMANAAWWLRSDEASYITGTGLLVDGGYAKFERNPSA